MNSNSILNKIKIYGISPKKFYGQNFILDENILKKIVERSNINEKIYILEIGPGPGGLTHEILKSNVNQVFVIEKDKDLLPFLEDIKKLFPNKLNIILEDALCFDIKKLNNNPFKIISNLPYNISTILLIKWLTTDICNTSCMSLTLMFQKEVAERIVAKKGSSKRSRISIISELYTNARMVLNVSPGSFVPKPKVDSAFIRFNMKRTPLINDENYIKFNRLVRDAVNQRRKMLKNSRFNHNQLRLKLIIDTAFNQKRKMVRSSLKKVFPNVELALKKVGIEKTERPQSIELKSFCDLSLI